VHFVILDDFTPKLNSGRPTYCCTPVACDILIPSLFLCAFARSREAIIIFVMSVYHSCSLAQNHVDIKGEEEQLCASLTSALH